MDSAVGISGEGSSPTAEVTGETSPPPAESSGGSSEAAPSETNTGDGGKTTLEVFENWLNRKGGPVELVVNEGGICPISCVKRKWWRCRFEWMAEAIPPGCSWQYPYLAGIIRRKSKPSACPSTLTKALVSLELEGDEIGKKKQMLYGTVMAFTTSGRKASDMAVFEIILLPPS